MIAQVVMVIAFIVAWITFVVVPVKINIYENHRYVIIRRNTSLIGSGLLLGLVSMLTHTSSVDLPVVRFISILFLAVQCAIFASLFIGYSSAFIAACFGIRGENLNYKLSADPWSWSKYKSWSLLLGVAIMFLALWGVISILDGIKVTH